MFGYIAARLNQAALEESYREYVTDSFYLQGQGKTAKQRWRELITPKEPEDEEPPEKILAHVLERTGLVV